MSLPSLRLVRPPGPVEKTPPPSARDEVVLEWSNAANELCISFERFPLEVTPPAAIAIVTKGAQATTVLRFDHRGRDDDDHRLTYLRGRSVPHHLHHVTCADCRALPDRLYRRFGLWRCRACWLKAAGAAVDLAPHSNRKA
jgi:hypothetical protein